MTLMNRALVPALLLSALFATPSLAALNEGDKAPDFSAQASLAGKAFWPMASTNTGNRRVCPSNASSTPPSAR